MKAAAARTVAEGVDSSSGGCAPALGFEFEFESSVKHVLVRGLTWNGAARLAAAVGVVARYLVFARLLRPFDFGVIGAASLAYTVLYAFTNSHIENALVAQHDEIGPYLDTVWLTMQAQGVLIFLVLFVGAHPLAVFFRIPHAQDAFLAIAPVALLTSLKSPAAGSRIYRQMAFRLTFVLTFAEQMAGFAGGLVGILWFRDWRGLMVAMYGEAFARSACTYWYFPYRPRFRFDLRRFQTMFAYGKWVTVRGLADYVSHHLDNIIVGHLLGPQALGEYQMAFRLGQMPATEVGGVVGLVSFPLVSRMPNDRRQRWRLFAAASCMVAVVGIVYGLALQEFGKVLIERAVGAKWLGAVPALRVLCFYGVAQGTVIVATHFLDGLGRPDASFRASLIATLGLAVLIYPLTFRFGSAGAATAALVSALLPIPIILKLCWDATTGSGCRRPR